MGKERVQTIVLSLLIVLSLFLTQQIWIDAPSLVFQSDSINLTTEKSVIEAARNRLISPQRILLGFGRDSLSGINSNYAFLSGMEMEEGWLAAQRLLLEFFDGDPSVDLTDEIEYQTVRQARFMELEFGKGISSVLISLVFGSGDNGIVNEIKEMEKILIPANNRGVIYVAEGNGSYYRVSLPEYRDQSLMDYMDAYGNGTEYVKYYSLLENYVDNTTLMPLNYTLPVPQYFVQSEIDVLDQAATVELVKGFFNQNFDFVKTIRETSGALVYLYDYGQKSVRINNRGRLEFNEEIGTVSSTSVMESLDAAVAFTLAHGGFPEGTYLKEVRQITNQQSKGYYFGFGYHLEGYPLVFTGNNMKHFIEVEVYGDRVRTYRRLVRKKMNLSSIVNTILSPRTVITNNLTPLLEQYATDQSADPLTLPETIVWEKIKWVELVYYDRMEKKLIEQLIPAWRVIIGNRLYYFDSYTGEVLHSSLLN